MLPDGPAMAMSMEEVVERFATQAGERLKVVQVRKFDHFRPG